MIGRISWQRGFERNETQICKDQMYYLGKNQPKVATTVEQRI